MEAHAGHLARAPVLALNIHLVYTSFASVIWGAQGHLVGSIRGLLQVQHVNTIDGAQDVATLHFRPLANATLVYVGGGRLGAEARVKAGHDELVIAYQPSHADANQVRATSVRAASASCVPLPATYLVARGTHDVARHRRLRRRHSRG